MIATPRQLMVLILAPLSLGTCPQQNQTMKLQPLCSRSKHSVTFILSSAVLLLKNTQELGSNEKGNYASRESTKGRLSGRNGLRCRVLWILSTFSNGCQFCARYNPTHIVEDGNR